MDATIVDIQKSISSLAAHMDDVKKAVARMERMDEKQTKILESLASNKTEHEQMQSDIQILRDRTHKFASEAQAIPFLDDKIRRGEYRLDMLETTLENTRISVAATAGKAAGIATVAGTGSIIILGWVAHSLGWL